MFRSNLIMLSTLGKPSKLAELACLLFILGMCILSPGCSRSAPTLVKEEPPPPGTKSTPDATTARSLPNFPTPEPAEVKDAIERVFKGVVTIETDRNPYFIAGDFNGDLSQDLVVVVKPTRGKLLEINDELAAWTIVDPVPRAKPALKGAPYPELHAEMTRRRRALVDEADILLAVIHGAQSKGWRDPQATQTYVLKGAAGGKMQTQSRKQIVWAGNEEKLPRIWGDVITQTIREQYGFLYYNGAKYAWYNPRTYNPESARMVHGRISEGKR
ncbi:MAG: hypothetical protein MOB07_08570 [Acidobacteria bacterium]|nr:hypothetical protein [Acidobacteriota bacterium]